MGSHGGPAPLCPTENMSIHLGEQDVELQEGHRAILADLGRVQSRTQQVYAKIGTGAGGAWAGCSQLGLWQLA